MSCFAIPRVVPRWARADGAPSKSVSPGRVSPSRWRPRMRDFTTDVTPLVLTRDEEPNIARTLAQLAWAREVIVVDSMSVDATVAIAQSFANVRVVQRTFDDLASQWNFALAQASTEWVLTLDADYYVPPEFLRELAAIEPPPNVSAYEAKFKYAVGGRPLRASLY